MIHNQKQKQYSITHEQHKKQIEILTPSQIQYSSPQNSQPSCYITSSIISSISQHMKPSQQQQKNQRKQANIQKPQNMHKIMLLMRQQIQIANKFYTDKMKILLTQQAKQICKLRQKISQNQRQLIKKSQQIDTLLSQKQITPKKKLSILSQQQPTFSITNQSYNKLKQKITSLQQEIKNISSYIADKNQIQKQLNNKIQCCQKGTIKYLAVKIGNCMGKFQQFINTKQCDIERIYMQFNYLTNTINANYNHHHNNNNNSNSIKYQQPVNLKLSTLQQQISDIKQQLCQLKTRNYQYQSYQLQILKKQLTKITQKLQHISYSQNKYKQHSPKSTKAKIKLSKKNTTKTLQSQKLINRQGQYNSSRYNNLIKSQKMITTNYTANTHNKLAKQQLISAIYHNNTNHSNNVNSINNTNYYSINMPHTHNNIKNHSNNNRNININQKNIIYPVNNYSNIHQYNHKQPQNIIKSRNQYQRQPNNILQQNILMNLSTPVLYKNISDKNNMYARQNNSPIHRHGTQLIKTVNLSTQASPYTSKNPHKNSHKSSHKSNIPVLLQTQFYQQHTQNQQSLQFQPQRSQCQQYQQSCSSSQYESQQNQQQLQQRLIYTIRNQHLTMPLLVQIDQTGCLKCVKNGMYLVDLNNDVFYLGQEQMRIFGNKGILKQVRSQ